MAVTGFEPLTPADLDRDYGQRPRRTEAYYLVWLSAGQGSVQVDFYPHPVRPGQLFFVTAGRDLRTHVTEAEGTVLRFTDEFLHLSEGANQPVFRDLFFHYFCHSPFISPTPAEQAKLQALWADIGEEYRRPLPSREVLQSYLTILLVQYQRIIKQNALQATTEPRYQKVTGLRQDIEQHFRARKDAPFYAGKQSLSPKRLNEITKEALGKTVTDLVHERTLLEAKRLLVLTDQSVKEIAYALGYDDVPYFYRFFKKHAAQTPEDFRRAAFKMSSTTGTSATVPA